MFGGAMKLLIGGLVVLLCMTRAAVSQSAYPWLDESESMGRTIASIAPPENTTRMPVESSSFASWLRQLPLLPDSTPVRLYSGELKPNQHAHAAVVNIDVGRTNLQQCADAAIRLRAEYLYAQHRYDDIMFRFTSGDSCDFRRWIMGERPRIDGNAVHWSEPQPADSSYTTFREYLTTVFMYAGTLSLSRDLPSRSDLCSVEAGDIFLQGGSPGHAVIVLDIADDPDSKTRYFLLAQSFMPAQNIHVLKNPSSNDLSPWYSCACKTEIVTPEWTFRCSDLRTF